MPEIAIASLTDSARIRAALRDLLVETVANGGSVSFMHPLAPEVADAFWEESLAAAARDERIILGAFDGECLLGTVTLRLDCPPNQPHRAEIAKLMTRREPPRSRGGDGVDARCRARGGRARANPPGARHGGRGWCLQAV